MSQSKHQPAGAAAGSGSRNTGGSTHCRSGGRCRGWGRADGFGSAVVGAELVLGAAQPTGHRWPCSPGRDAKAAARCCTGAGGRRRRGHTGGRSAGARWLGFRPLGWMGNGEEEASRDCEHRSDATGGGRASGLRETEPQDPHREDGRLGWGPGRMGRVLPGANGPDWCIRPSSGTSSGPPGGDN
jgi:hypothetical protein